VVLVTATAQSNGRTCAGCGSAVVLPDGYCYNCSPAISAEQRKASRVRGGLSVTRQRGPRGLRDEQLGPLQTAADAQRWAETLARAVACGDLSASQANAAGRLLGEFVKARDLHTRERELADLRRDVQAIKKGRLA
jgi:hypothetical protein